MSAEERRRRVRNRTTDAGSDSQVTSANGNADDSATPRESATPSIPVPELAHAGGTEMRSGPIAPGSPEAEAAWQRRKGALGAGTTSTGTTSTRTVSAGSGSAGSVSAGSNGSASNGGFPTANGSNGSVRNGRYGAPNAPTVDDPHPVHTNGNSNGNGNGNGTGTLLAGPHDGVEGGPIDLTSMRVTGSASPAPVAPGSGQHPRSELVVMLSASGIVRFVSDGVEPILGLDGAQVIGRDVSTLVSPEDGPLVAAALRDLRQGRRTAISMRCGVTHRNGESLEMELVAEHQPDHFAGDIIVSANRVSADVGLEARVREMDRRNSALIEALADGLLVLDGTGRIVRVNRAFEDLFGVDRADLVSRAVEHVLRASVAGGAELLDEQGDALEVEMHPVLTGLYAGQRVIAAEVGYRQPDTHIKWVRINVQPVLNPAGRQAGAVATFADVTAKRSAEYALRQEREFLRVLLETLDEGIIACDAQGRKTVFNPSARDLLNVPDDVEPIGRASADPLWRSPQGMPISSGEDPLMLSLSGERLRNHEFVLAAPDGSDRFVRVNGQVLEDEFGWKLGAVIAMHDVTEERRSRDELRHLAFHDQLTGLANRLKLYESMREAIAELGSRPDRRLPARRADAARVASSSHKAALAVFLLDLDGFKAVNDNHGHRMGDELLKGVADRLVAAVRPEDTVARLSGDEFVVMCRIDGGEAEMEDLRTKIEDAVEQPYRILGATVRVGVSVGATMTEDSEADYSHLLGFADDDMFEIKERRGTSRRLGARHEVLRQELRGHTPARPEPPAGGSRAGRSPIPPGSSDW